MLVVWDRSRRERLPKVPGLGGDQQRGAGGRVRADVAEATVKPIHTQMSMVFFFSVFFP